MTDCRGLLLAQQRRANCNYISAKCAYTTCADQSIIGTYCYGMDHKVGRSPGLVTSPRSYSCTGTSFCPLAYYAYPEINGSANCCDSTGMIWSCDPLEGCRCLPLGTFLFIQQPVLEARAAAASPGPTPTPTDSVAISSGLSTGAKAGIAIGAIVGAAALFGLAFWLAWLLYQRRNGPSAPFDVGAAEKTNEPHSTLEPYGASGHHSTLPELVPNQAPETREIFSSPKPYTAPRQHNTLPELGSNLVQGRKETHSTLEPWRAPQQHSTLEPYHTSQYGNRAQPRAAPGMQEMDTDTPGGW
ncbi:hypothetical protein CC86DRAFT_432472 [Ophiobolus disseminans]|uniref:Uncharacterized protein n=1 Tax=Ophiobolus disseminans TaxID=1469910 RepID=A0A6A6ZDU1_9PLEO|nr:hypothetical protein CC86DRAFT_432472 [Ophiobolus disseminans]